VMGMRVLIQRVDGARVDVDHQNVGAVEGPGLVVFVGVTHTDTAAVAERLARKVYALRIFNPTNLTHTNVCLPPGVKGEVSAAEAGLPLLVISQFTLYADTRKGRRPGWSAAAPGPVAEPLIDSFVAALQKLGADVSTGIFGADMRVSLTNDGPMTLWLEEDAPATT
jgi:D-tyrosyl-tRNA(Tyr) deacylase